MTDTIEKASLPIFPVETWWLAATFAADTVRKADPETDHGIIRIDDHRFEFWVADDGEAAHAIAGDSNPPDSYILKVDDCWVRVEKQDN